MGCREAGYVSNWGLRRRCRKGGAGCRRAPRCEEADGARAGAEVGWMPRGGRPGRGEAGTGELVPPYQAAQMILLRLHREGGGPGQRPAREIDAAAEVQVLGLAHGSRGGQGASIRRLGHGWSVPAATELEPRQSDPRLPEKSTESEPRREGVKKRRGSQCLSGKVVP